MVISSHMMQMQSNFILCTFEMFQNKYKEANEQHLMQAIIIYTYLFAIPASPRVLATLHYIKFIL